MALIRCRECDREISDQEKTCANCNAPVRAWPLSKFARLYVIGGLLFAILYTSLFDPVLLGYLAAIWGLVGLALALIIVGRAGRNTSAGANLVYLVGIAWLALLLIVGVFRILHP